MITVWFTDVLLQVYAAFKDPLSHEGHQICSTLTHTCTEAQTCVHCLPT